jgi:hypothetical protein
MHISESRSQTRWSISVRGGGSSIILDTAELFHASLSIDDITFQEYSELKEKKVPDRQSAEEAIALSTDKGFPYFSSMSGILRGWSVAEQGNVKEGIAQINQSLRAWEVTESEVNKTYHLALLAEAYGKNV